MSRLVMAALTAIAAALGAGYALLVPFGEKPDEPSHFARLVYEARYGRVPGISGYAVFPTIVPYEAVQPPVYYWIASRLLASMRPVTWSVAAAPYVGCVERSRRFVVEGSGELPPQVAALRFLGLACVLTSGLLVSSGATRLGVTPLQASLSGALALCTPQVLFVSTGVSNDGLAGMVGALILWLTIMAGTTGSAPAAVAAGAATALGVGVKLTLAPYGPGSVLFLALGRGRPLRAVGAFLLGVAAVGIGGMALVHTSSPADVRPLVQRLGLHVADVTRKDYLASVRDMFATYWARFGWMDLRAPTVVQALWVLLLGTATLGWMARPPSPARTWGGPWAMLGAAIAGWMLTLKSSHQVQGRFFLPLAPVISLLLGTGVGAITKPVVFSAVVLATVGANALCLTQLRERYRPAAWPTDMVIDAHQCSSDRVVLETLSGGATIGQTFLAVHPGLTAIDVVFEGKTLASDSVLMEIADVATQRVLRTASRRVDERSLGGYTRFTFPPIMKSRYRLLMFTLWMAAPDSGGSLSVRFRLGDPYLDGVRLVDGQVRDGDLQFVAWALKTGEAPE